MKGLITTINNIFKIEELRQKLILTFILIAVYRIGSFIVLPGVDAGELSAMASSGTKGLLGLLDMFVGGSFGRASVFALGVMPYISASIAVQLLTIAVPYFQKIQKEGDSGRRKITQWTRYLTVIVALAQGLGYVTFLSSIAGDAIVVNKFAFTVLTMITLTAGTVFCMWMGEKITDKGIGNGTSILIMTGIMARLPFSFVSELNSRMEGAGGMVIFLVELVVLAAIIMGIILLVQGVRQIPVQYAKRVIGNKQYGGVRQFIPIRVNSSGVMPIIFAQALMFIPSFIAQFFPNSDLMQSIQSGSFQNSFWYNFGFFLMVVLFTYFYTALIINPTQMADDMKRNNGYIPGVQPGTQTAEFIDGVVSRITLPGALCLAFVAILPAIVSGLGVNSQFAAFYGGTSILIAVAVMLDTLQQIESHLLMHHYDGLMKGDARIKGRQQQPVADANA
ncbi:MAG: preprotein translocase subunit SecY [Chitinophagales bacterium]|nr:preprotein translocase subunit SecY [Chitinophagales bacterium]